MKRTLDIIQEAMETGTQPCIAFSGGSDSLVLLDILYRKVKVKAPLVFCNTGMEYTETISFIKDVAGRYDAHLHVVNPDNALPGFWQERGWPFLGKMPARTWTRKHKDQNFGFRLDVSTCCELLKIRPTRDFIKAQGFDLTLTGMRGSTDDALRSYRQHRDGYLYKDKKSGVWQCHPLLGWTDLMIRRYTRAHDLPKHPAKERGLITTGCMYCGGGCQFTNSGYPILRKLNPKAWKKFFVTWKAGEVLLSIKHDRPLWQIREALDRMGGLETVAKARPWIFDFSRSNPLKGYTK
ncbi:MAG: phosphoadenosine phosphosulfate reductase family protein [Desulfobacteraceae bacterium]